MVNEPLAEMLTSLGNPANSPLRNHRNITSITMTDGKLIIYVDIVHVAIIHLYNKDGGKSRNNVSTILVLFARRVTCDKNIPPFLAYKC